MFEPKSWASRLAAARDYAGFERRYRLAWVAGMCRMVGVDMPSDEESLALAARAERWIRPQVEAAIPGAAQTRRALSADGYCLFTASGSSSEDLDTSLRGMQVRDCFERLYGPDLIGALKLGPDFYL